MAYFKENIGDWEKIASLVGKSERVFITTHVNPDGDAIGSVMALAGFFMKMGKQCTVINDSDTPETYQFLDPGGIINTGSDTSFIKNSPGKNDIVFFLDLVNYSRAGKIADFLVNNDAVKIIIDHHFPEEIDADIIVDNTRASSTGSLVYDFMCYCDRSLIDKKIASAVLTAIISDTGFFRYSNTTATTHLITSELYSYGARIVDIRRKLEAVQMLCRQKLLGLTLSNIKVSDCGRIAYSLITTEMFRNAGARREHTEGIIDQIRIIRNIKVASLIIQEGNGLYKASFRTTDNIPANEIAAKLGGGGHPKAAGASVNGSIEDVTSRMLEAVTVILDSKGS